MFRIRVPAGNGFRYRLDGVPRVLYRWPDLLDERIVIIVEGEKAADRLWSLGVPATCAPGGAGHWTEVYTRALWDAYVLTVAIVPDHDAPGAKHAAKVAASCHGFRPDPADLGVGTDDFADGAFAPLRAVIVRLPDLPPHGDVEDWLDAGGTPAELLRLCAEAEPWEPARDRRRQAAATADRRRLLGRERVRRHRARRKAVTPVCSDAAPQQPDLVTHVCSGPECNAR